MKSISIAAAFASFSQLIFRSRVEPLRVRSKVAHFAYPYQARLGRVAVERAAGLHQGGGE